MMSVEITGTSAQFEAAALPGMHDVYMPNDSGTPLRGDRWRVDAYVSSAHTVKKIRAAGLSVRVLQTAEQVRQERENIARTFSRQDGGATGHGR